jgi:hypothetical protein
MARVSKSVWISAALLLAGLWVFVSVAYKRAAYERSKSIEHIALSSGEILRVEHESWRPRYIGGHVFGFSMPGQEGRMFKFERDGRQLRWRGVATPVVLDFDGERSWLVVCDREMDFQKIRLRACRFSGGRWHEERLTKVPRRLLIQNMSLEKDNGRRADGSVINEFDLVRLKDPADSLFRDSLTAKMWFGAEHGIEQWETASGIDEASLRRIKAKYFTDLPATNSPSVPPNN